MKMRGTAFVLLAAALSSSLGVAEVAKVTPGETGGSVSSFALNKPPTNTSGQHLEIYSNKNKRDVFTINPQNINDPSQQSVGGAFSGQLSPSAQNNIGFSFGIPLPGSQQAGRAGGLGPANRFGVPMGPRGKP